MCTSLFSDLLSYVSKFLYICFTVLYVLLLNVCFYSLCSYFVVNLGLYFVRFINKICER